MLHNSQCFFLLLIIPLPHIISSFECKCMNEADKKNEDGDSMLFKKKLKMVVGRLDLLNFYSLRLLTLLFLLRMYYKCWHVLFFLSTSVRLQSIIITRTTYTQLKHTSMSRSFSGQSKSFGISCFVCLGRNY